MLKAEGNFEECEGSGPDCRRRVWAGETWFRSAIPRSESCSRVPFGVQSPWEVIWSGEQRNDLDESFGYIRRACMSSRKRGTHFHTDSVLGTAQPTSLFHITEKKTHFFDSDFTCHPFLIFLPNGRLGGEKEIDGKSCEW